MERDYSKEGLNLRVRDEGLEPVTLKELLSEPQGHWNIYIYAVELITWP